MTRNGGIAETVTGGPVGDARDREQTVLRYDTSHIQICRTAFNLRAPNARTERHQMGIGRPAIPAHMCSWSSTQIAGSVLKSTGA
jgi:hypothetical protein